MNTLVISDTHLGKYNKKKDIFLKELVSQYERIVINGDFWDSWGTSFQKFVNSKYRGLLNLLKSKETFYIYGNHDYRAEAQKKLGEIFSNKQGIELDITIGGKSFHFEHGHRFFHNQKKVHLINYYYLIDKIPFLGPLIYKLVGLSYRLFQKRLAHSRVGISRNEYAKSIKPSDTYYVTSHTHVPEVDEKERFFNTGCVMGKFFSYLVIDANGNVELITK
jgi:predicted phosphodiesterase